MSMTDPAEARLPIDGPIDMPMETDGWAGDPDIDEGVAVPQTGASASVGGLVEFARGRLVDMVEDARDSLVGQVRGLKSLADLLVDNLGQNAEPVGRIVGEAAGSIDAIADALAEKSVEELVEDGRALVQAQPAAAVGIAIAVGFLAGRMLKAAQD